MSLICRRYCTPDPGFAPPSHIGSCR